MAGQLPPGEEMCIRILPCKARRRGRQRKGLICKCERLRAREDFRMEYIVLHKTVACSGCFTRLQRAFTNWRQKQKGGIELRHWFHMRLCSLNLLSLEENPAEEREIHGNENICIIAVLVKCIFIWGCFQQDLYEHTEFNKRNHNSFLVDHSCIYLNPLLSMFQCKNLIRNTGFSTQCFLKGRLFATPKLNSRTQPHKTKLENTQYSPVGPTSNSQTYEIRQST